MQNYKTCHIFQGQPANHARGVGVTQPAPVTPPLPPPKPATAATGMQTIATIKVCQFVVESTGITAHVNKYVHPYPWLSARMT